MYCVERLNRRNTDAWHYMYEIILLKPFQPLELSCRSCGSLDIDTSSNDLSWFFSMLKGALMDLIFVSLALKGHTFFAPRVAIHHML